jgi:hypothetical protein
MADAFMRDERGEIALRDIIFSIVIFSTMMALAAAYVLNMAQEYGNTNMSNEFFDEDNVGNLGENMFNYMNGSVGNMSSEIDKSAGTFGTISGTIEGVGTILKIVITSPLYVKTTITSVLTSMRVPYPIPTIMGNMFLLLLTAMVIFVILSSVSRGGTKL